ncbi:MAG: hypothetical protein ACOCV1_02660 [Bacillota bacterium]
MKKYLYALFILLTASLFLTNRVFAGDSDYLPGGKNYISHSNLTYVEEQNYLYTTNNILVKPDNDYTLSLPMDFLTSQHLEVTISFYNNETLISDLNIDILEFNQNFSPEGNGFYSFYVLFDCNYLRLEFHNTDFPNDFSLDEEVVGMQLEEGTSGTNYESYIQGTMIDTESPYFQSSGSIISYVDQPITDLEILESLVAIDAIDGDVSENIVIVDDQYSDYMHTIGSYHIVFSVTDSSGNSTEITIPIEVVDVLDPVFSDLGVIQAVYPNVYSVEDIKAMLSASDNYDGDISNNITLIEEDYTNNSDKVGTYEMTFSVSDSSNNTTNYTQVIEVVDNEGPLIEGVSEIHTGYQEYITETEIKNQLTVTDNYDSDLDLTIVTEENTYKNNANILGNYSIVFSVTDSSGNRTEKTIDIIVIDSVSPMVYFDLAYIQVYADTVMDLPDFAELLTKSNELDSTKSYLITVKYDSYTKHANIPGTYHLSLIFEDEVGDKLEKDLEIRVINRGVDDIYIGEEIEDIGFFDKAKNYLITGGISLAFIISNIVWFVIIKKK